LGSEIPRQEFRDVRIPAMPVQRSGPRRATIPIMPGLSISLCSVYQLRNISLSLRIKAGTASGRLLQGELMSMRGGAYLGRALGGRPGLATGLF
jgi:hypothetical protein